MLVHRPYEAHQNIVAATGAVVLNFTLPFDVSLPSAFRVGDPEALLKLESSDLAFEQLLLEPVQKIAQQFTDWPDQLAAALNADTSLSIRHWAIDNGLAAATVSRGFRKVFGISAARYRAEARARHAMAELRKRDTPLAALAHELNFADQAHMSRAIRAIANDSPSRWRQVNSVQDFSAGARYQLEHENKPNF
jgi:AraC-like DNA-binding protein